MKPILKNRLTPAEKPRPPPREGVGRGGGGSRFWGLRGRPQLLSQVSKMTWDKGLSNPLKTIKTIVLGL